MHSLSLTDIDRSPHCDNDCLVEHRDFEFQLSAPPLTSDLVCLFCCFSSLGNLFEQLGSTRKGNFDPNIHFFFFACCFCSTSCGFVCAELLTYGK